MFAAASFAGAADLATGRVTRDLQVLYPFEQPDGKVVHDQSGVGDPLNLVISDPAKVTRKPGSLVVRASTTIASSEPARKIIDGATRSGELTLEAWIVPQNDKQEGPARLVSLSQNTSHRNFTLGQEGNRYDARLRTTSTSTNGLPSLATPGKSLQSQLTHVVYTRDRAGVATLYLNGQPAATRRIAGSLTNWSKEQHLSLGNEATGERPWLGEFRLVAVYSCALARSEVQQNFAAGPTATLSPEQLAAQRQLAAARHFESQVAPLLARRCVECHDRATREGGLDLSRHAGLLAGGVNGRVVQPGKHRESSLWTLVESDEMPQDREPLTVAEKTILGEWIDNGAVWTLDLIDPVLYRHNQEAGKNWVQRLTVAEYIQTVRSAVGVDISAEATKLLPPDLRADGFSNTAYNLNVDLEHVKAYATLAEMIVERMDIPAFASKYTRQRQLTDDHMRKLVGDMGRQLLRGPLQEHEVASFRGIASTVASGGGDFDEAVRYILEAMLQSPRFIYRIENQRGGAASWRVGPYELASRMSYIVWGGPPDEELLRAAEAGELADRQRAERQLARMLDDPRAVDRSLQFISEWLDLRRLENLRPRPEKFPRWDSALADDMRAETLAFFKHVVWERKRPLAELLTTQATFATPRLARHYGLKERPAGDSTLARYDLEKVPERGGLLTQGSLLTIGGDDASMVTRGLFVLEDLLFSEVGSPPPGLDVTPVPASPGKSHRAISELRVANQSCGGCHARFEPLAFGLERFDGLGGYRETDEFGNRLRQDGKIHFPGEEKPVSYQNVAEMMELLAGSDRVRRCLTRKVTQFAIGRPLVAADARVIDDIHKSAQADGGTYASLVKAIVLSDLVQKSRSDQATTGN